MLIKGTKDSRLGTLRRKKSKTSHLCAILNHTMATASSQQSTCQLKNQEGFTRRHHTAVTESIRPPPADGKIFVLGQ